MPRRDESKFHKEIIWSRLRDKLGQFVNNDFAPDKESWRTTEDKRTSIIIIYSKFYPKEKQYSFTISIGDFNNSCKYENSFVILVAGSSDNAFVIPVPNLLDYLRQLKWNVVYDVSYQIHIALYESSYYLREFNLAEFHQNYELFRLNNLHHSGEVVTLGRNYPEGATLQITVNAYERNREARNACLSHYGFNCYICGFNFETKYGDIGREFIHVHHIRPLSEIRETYEVNPIEDLRPVCPNCHAMLHRMEPAYSIEEVNAMMNRDR